MHILLQRHNVIWAKGPELKSFHPSNTAHYTVDPGQLGALFHLSPEADAKLHSYGDCARRNLSSFWAAILRYEIAG